MRATRNFKPARHSERALFVVVPLLAAAGALAVWFCADKGYTLYYGDAESHLNHARRIFDSRTPGPDQLGTPWLPLPHLLMLPLVRHDGLWRSGLAGAIPSSMAFVAAGAFLFSAIRRLFGAHAGAAAAALFALNPNLLYLQATPMNEPLMLAALMALFYFTVLHAQTRSLWAAAAAGAAACAGTLTRYEGWFLLPFAALYLARTRLASGLLFCAIAALGPLAWLAHNRWYFSDALSFYWGPYSARAIQGNLDYPGKNDWPKAWLFYRTTASQCVGIALFWTGAAGLAAALWKRAFWPVALLLLTPIFYLWSLHSSGNPIWVPELWYGSYYNTRYGLSWLPLAVLGASALVALAPRRLRAPAAAAVVLAAALPWLFDPNVITWKESQVNSEARRAWTREAAGYLRAHYRAGDGVLTSFGDLTGIFRSAGIPLRQTLTGDNGPLWLGATARPDLFLWEHWAVAVGGDPVQTAINRAGRHGPYYRLERRIVVKHAPVVEIYRRSLPERFYANPVHQGARRPQ